MKLKDSISLTAFILTIIIASCSKTPDNDEMILDEISADLEMADTTDEYLVDTATSFISWVATKPDERHNGMIRVKEGSFYISNDSIVFGTIKVNMTSIEVLDLQDNRQLHDKLLNEVKSGNLLDIKNFPSAEFEITDLKAHKKAPRKRKGTYYMALAPNYTATGNLTLLGKTIPISFPVRIDIMNNKLEAMAKIDIDRTKWGITYLNERDPRARAENNYIHNNVNINLTIIARHKSQVVFN